TVPVARVARCGVMLAAGPAVAVVPDGAAGARGAVAAGMVFENNAFGVSGYAKEIDVRFNVASFVARVAGVGNVPAAGHAMSNLTVRNNFFFTYNHVMLT